MLSHCANYWFCPQEQRVAEARVARQSALEARERAAAAALVQGYVAELLPAVLAGLRDQGYLLQRTMRGNPSCAGTRSQRAAPAIVSSSRVGLLIYVNRDRGNTKIT